MTHRSREGMTGALLALTLAALGGCNADDRTLVAVDVVAGSSGQGGGAGEAGASGQGGEGGGGVSGSSGQGGAGPGGGGQGGGAGASGQAGQGGATVCFNAADCNDLNPCTADGCQGGVCVNLAEDAIAPPQVDGDCQVADCSGGKVVSLADDGDVPADDGDPCTIEACQQGVPGKELLDGDPCQLGGLTGTCQAGVCQVVCSSDAACDDGNPCTTNACAGTTCVFTPLSDDTPTPGVSDVAGDCKKSVCLNGVATSLPDPGDAGQVAAGQVCKQAVCDGTAPGVSNKPNGLECGEGVICVGGECKEPSCGDTFRSADEECEQGDLGGKDCLTQGFDGGQLACGAGCLFDTTGCTKAGKCGDGKLDAGEECDDATTPGAPGNGCSTFCKNEPAFGELVITEVMIDPEAPGGNDDGEWFEVFNKSARAFDLRGLRLRSNGDETTIAGVDPIVITPGSYAVLARYGDPKKNGNLKVLYSYENKLFFSNGNSDGLLIEVASMPKVEIDSMYWTSDINGEKEKYKGVSYSLDPNFPDATQNDDTGYWCPSTSQISASNQDKGTPGAPNDPCPLGLAPGRGRGHGRPVMTSRVNPWKVSTLVLTGVLIVGALGPTAEAAGPARLTKALAALRSGKKLLDEAKEPPAVPHAQSLAAVNAAIAAVEREIKAYEAAQAKAKPAGSASSDAKAPPKKKDDKPRVDPGESD